MSVLTETTGEKSAIALPTDGDGGRNVPTKSAVRLACSCAPLSADIAPNLSTIHVTRKSAKTSYFNYPPSISPIDPEMAQPRRGSRANDDDVDAAPPPHSKQWRRMGAFAARRRRRPPPELRRQRPRGLFPSIEAATRRTGQKVPDRDRPPDDSCSALAVALLCYHQGWMDSDTVSKGRDRGDLKQRTNWGPLPKMRDTRSDQKKEAEERERGTLFTSIGSDHRNVYPL